MEREKKDETEPKRAKIVCLEGISCCGKTLLMDGIQGDTIDKVRIQVPRNLVNPTPEYFLRNDLEKFKMAAFSKKRTVLMDRGYLSTMVFYTVKADLDKTFNVWPIYRWYFENVGTNIPRPDYYFYLKIPPQLSIARARGIRPFDENNFWLKSPERASFWYERLFSTIEQSVPLFILDGTTPPTILIDEVKEILNSLGLI